MQWLNFPFKKDWIFQVSFDSEFKFVQKSHWLLCQHVDAEIEIRKAIYPKRLLQDFVKPLLRYLEFGDPFEEELSHFLDFSKCTNFQSRIYQALLKTSHGKFTTYSKLAQSAGNPMAARAVGTSMRVNSFALLVPCHRVLRTDGALGNYSAPMGVELKKTLLIHEGVKL